jgi:outer membrane lipase/esterase
MSAAFFPLSPALRRFASLSALACTALALNGCGGGDRVSAYEPQRMVSFGDENSLIDSYTDGTANTLFKTDGSTPGSIKGLVYTVNSVALGPIDGNLQALFYVCADNAITGYSACDSSNAIGGTLTPGANNQWFEDPNYANRLIRVEHDTVNHTRLDLLYAWSCSGNVIWTQVIAHAFKLGYSSYNGAVGQCPTDNYANAVTYAGYKHRIADVVAQINNHMGELGSGTLVTIMAGQWDVLDMYAEVSNQTRTLDSAQAELKNRANQLIAAVQAITNAGGKVVVSFTPDLGESPKAHALGINGSNGVLYKLTNALNNQLYQLGNNQVIPKQGRVVAIVNPETLTDVNTRSTSYTYGAALCPAADSNDNTASTGSTTALKDPLGRNVLTTSAGYDADAAVKYCNTSSTTLAGSTSTYMWADPIHFAPLGHSLIGSTGYTRANNQF